MSAQGGLGGGGRGSSYDYQYSPAPAVGAGEPAGLAGEGVVRLQACALQGPAGPPGSLAAFPRCQDVLTEGANDASAASAASTPVVNVSPPRRPDVSFDLIYTDAHGNDPPPKNIQCGGDGTMPFWIQRAQFDQHGRKVTSPFAA
jgi:hypothetical protein